MIQPDAVRDVIADLGVPFDVVEDAEEKYRHGKLVEAIGADGSRWTLTGSPNLSARALLLSAADGGNIEAGVISRPRVSLFPPECRPIPLDEVPAVRITGSAASRAAADVTLLAAVRTNAGLEVVFARPPTEAVRIVASHAAEFDRWKDAGTVPAGAATSRPGRRGPARWHAGPLRVRRWCGQRLRWHRLRHRPGHGHASARARPPGTAGRTRPAQPR